MERARRGLSDEVSRCRAPASTACRRALPPGWDQDLPSFPPDPKGVAGRDASAKALNAIAHRVPWLLGGSADLWPSTRTLLTFEGAGDFQPPECDGSYGGRNFHFGIREHAMCAFVNGMALSGLRPYGSSFLVFTDYCRGALRLSALMEVPAIYIWTHDSISLGEDGPTHQPIEHLASLRAMPGMIVLRPADANEVVEAGGSSWGSRTGRSAWCSPARRFPRSIAPVRGGERRGAGRVRAGRRAVGEARRAAARDRQRGGALPRGPRAARGRRNPARVVSLPSWEIFEEQPEEYRDSVLPPEVTARVSIEAASTFGWAKFTGTRARSWGCAPSGSAHR